MTAIHETAYPRLKTEYSLEELTAVYTPSTAEIDYVFSLYRQVGPRTFMLVKLKLLQRLGYFVPLATVPEDMAPSPEDYALVREAIEAIDLWLEGLPPKARQVFLLRRLDGMKHTEIAEVMGLSVATVERYMKQALMQLMQTPQPGPN